MNPNNNNNNNNNNFSDPNEELFTYFPIEMWNAIALAEPDVSTQIKRTYSMTCKYLHSFFQPDLDKGYAQPLLRHVLQGKVREAKKMYVANPRLLFIEATAKEYAAGLDENGKPVYRIVTGSPFQAAARAGDIWLLKDMKQQLGKVFDKRSDECGDTLIAEQLAEAFPNGFEYPPSTYDFKGLVDAINNDPLLINSCFMVKPGKASPATEKALAQFRKDFMPGTEKTGFLFNLNELIKACEVYDENYPNWSKSQSSLFWCQVVGYLERLVSACDAQVLCYGMNNVLIGKRWKRSFDCDFYPEGKISYFPLDSDSYHCLGGTFAIDSYHAGAAGNGCGIGGWLEVLKNYVNQRQQDFESFSNSCASQLTLGSNA